MAIDLLGLEEVMINSGLAGKIILVYSGNNQGKSKVASQLFPKQTLFLATEKGYNSLGGIKKVDVTDWKTFRDIITSLTPKKEENLKKIQDAYKCVVVDVADRLPEMCQGYICSKNGVDNISDIAWGGGYAQLKQEFSNQLNKLVLGSYCVVLICHEVTREITDPVSGEKYEYTQPRSTETKVGEILKDLPDFAIFLQNMGCDENGNVILSNGITTQHKNVFARSRFSQCPPKIEPFTAVNLRETIKYACEKEAEMLGLECVNYEAYIEQEIKEKQAKIKTRPQLLEMIKPIMTALYSSGNQEETLAVVEKYLGEGVKVSSATDGQIDKLEFILNDFKDMAEKKGIEV